MSGDWRYRVASLAGPVTVTVIALLIVNNVIVQSAATALPLLDRFTITRPTSSEFIFEVLITVAVFLVSFFPLYKPRPRRILDVVLLVQKRVFVAMFALAAIGYFDYTYRLPRLTVLLVTPLLLVTLPIWFVWIRRRPSTEGERTVVVGDDIDVIEHVTSEIEGSLLGYLCPTAAVNMRNGVSEAVADGGPGINALEQLGGLSRIEDILVEYNVDAVVLAFEQTDRAEFFGALDVCYEYGINAKIHRDHADSVLTTDNSVGTLVKVKIEPWDIQDYVLKRIFDVAFSTVGFVILSPVIMGIAVAVRLEDGGPVLYRQERTAVFGDPFYIYKFRTMISDSESAAPTDDAENDRITAFGRFLRTTHLDEVPQLWSVLLGEMSVVGPRAVWTEEEAILEDETQSWRQRWFVKPGLTGLAQVNDIKSTNPTEKLRLDLEYIRRQSFWLDMKLVVRQMWKVFEDVARTVWSSIFD